LIRGREALLKIPILGKEERCDPIQHGRRNLGAKSSLVVERTFFIGKFWLTKGMNGKWVRPDIFKVH